MVSLRDQLKPLRDKMRQQNATVVPVSQVDLVLRPEDDSVRFDSVVDDILKWLSNRAGKPLPNAAWERSSFEMEEPGAQPTAAVKIEGPTTLWAARIYDADKTVPMRTWITETAVAKRSEGGLSFWTRLTCTSRGKNPGIQRTIPGPIKQALQHGDVFLDGRSLSMEPWLVSTHADVAELVKFLQDPERRHDVIVISLPDNSDDFKDAGIDVDKLVKDVSGAAHVAIISGNATYALTNQVGKEFSVFGRAVRTYRPGFAPETDEYYDHPLSLWHRIENWEETRSETYSDFLINRTLSNTVSRTGREKELPAFSTLRRIASEQRMKDAENSNASAEERLKLVEDEFAKHQSETEELVEYYDSQVREAERQRDEIKSERDSEKQIVYNLQTRIRYLEYTINQSGIEQGEQIPSTLDNFRDWCSQHLSGKVEVHNRAIRGVKKSVYEDVKLIYDALLLLRDFYVPLKREGGQDIQSKYKEKLAELGLEETQTSSGITAGEQGDTYFVKFQNRSCLLDRHLTKGASRDPRWCFRLYFFWHEDTEQVVVGWLPSHLENRAS